MFTNSFYASPPSAFTITPSQHKAVLGDLACDPEDQYHGHGLRKCSM